MKTSSQSFAYNLEPVPEKLYRRVFRTMSTTDSYGSFSNLLLPIYSDYNKWLKSFYSSKINDFLDFKSTSHILTPQSEDIVDADDIIFEPCLLDCHTEEGFVTAATHLILHMIRTKQARSPTSVVTIGLSGGSSPMEIYRFLGGLRDLDIDFNRIILFMVDERYVESDDEMSNVRLIRNTLLKGWPIPESNLIFPDTSLPLEECVRKYEEDLEKVFGVVNVNRIQNLFYREGLDNDQGFGVDSSYFVSQEPASLESLKDALDSNMFKPMYPVVPDLVTLGIGEDFHIAGLFPEYLSTLDSSYVTDSVHRVMATYTETNVVRERITCSLPFLSCAKSKLFFLKGERKKKIWNTMLQYRHYDPIRFPATQIFTKPGCIAVLDSSTIRKVRLKIPMEQSDYLTFLLFGSGGDLARKKIYPALFHLFYLGFLPNRFHILAISRTDLDFDDFFSTISNDIFDSITTNIFMRNPAARFDFPTVISEFKNKCSRMTLQYDGDNLLEKFSERLHSIESGSQTSHRMVYLATPSEAYQNILKIVTSCCKPKNGWFRVMLEKPFGRDLDSCIEIDKFLSKHVSPDETFLVDHYLGKPMISCIISSKLSIRYGPLFNNNYVKSVHITLKEEIGSMGRSYFESYGIIRDMIQNHGMQLLSLIAMKAHHRKSISQDKYDVLKSIKTAELKDVVIGQYTASEAGCAYREENNVAPDSLCPTYCTMVFWIDNDDWRGVPFVVTSGKGLDEKSVELRLNLKNNLPEEICRDFVPSQLVYRIHPRPSVFWVKDLKEINVGEVRDGMTSDLESDNGMKPAQRILVDVESSAAKRSIEGAYELLFYYAFSNKREIFPTIHQVNEAWRVLTPVLNEITEKKLVPFFYPRGSAGPKEAESLLSLL
ncbi:glucose-6-phosphate-1-dehydrogenase [Theileria orientalis strain Shintoku]|uniref:glucose-6-phosphate dehydrogenase (NADP(+)) n=1 Tax=Theileria orientalis strain Shintoku TaxID=869250 RepID=J4C3V2_THEOR|nr:glucose-6-phosphate-1-dehydrogenase [Theileria orientalis strain Shintoku]BAM41086.1 glucose-6-phosphate-1-dehydrogenase [Theileria orientalis strain Shintoku]|eukprot:XP_009691387.1 glucose-6-phosphate-1-dehydrogenase [Theileria orientalis strain Shintoku]